MQCGTVVSYIYFFSFTVLVSMLIMNLSVAAVIEGLDTARKENMGIVEGDEIEKLIDLWQEYDEKATGWISMENLVFLLYELPPPLGKQSEKLDVENVNESNKNRDQSKKDRFLVSPERGIVLRKIDAMEILRDLKIKVSEDKNKVHFVDVFKALIKRILMKENIDYKLSPNLNNKITKEWTKKHKESSDTKSRYSALQQQAGQIINRWAKRILNKNKTGVKKAEKKSKKLEKKPEKPKEGEKK